ncbi:MAG: hypothetical protein K2P43_12205, partial [Lachnospiraceae bacterium]|nr:hypothetical protein [Lachnospiraceae bacterium]
PFFFYIYSTSTHILLCLVGWYICLRDAPAAHTGPQRLLFIAAMIVFAAVAVILGGMSIKAFLNGEYDRPDDGDGPES